MKKLNYPLYNFMKILFFIAKPVLIPFILKDFPADFQDRQIS